MLNYQRVETIWAIKDTLVNWLLIIGDLILPDLLGMIIF